MVGHPDMHTAFAALQAQSLCTPAAANPLGRARSVEVKSADFPLAGDVPGCRHNSLVRLRLTELFHHKGDGSDLHPFKF